VFLRIVGSILILGGVFGCGMMSSPKEDDNNKRISVPQKVSMEMPKELQEEKVENQKSSKEQEENRSIGYTFLKEDVAEVEKNIATLNQTLLFISLVKEDIDDRCRGVELNSSCVIDEEELSFVVDEKLAKEINDTDFQMGDEIFFGRVEFIKHSSKELYQYEIELEYEFTDTFMAIETIKWSEDKKMILSLYDEEDEDEKIRLDVDYEIKDDGTQLVYIEDSYLDKDTNSSDILVLDILKRAGRDRYYELLSDNDMIDYVDGKIEKGYFSTEGVLSSDGGYLLFYGEIDGEEFEEKELFDGEGNHLD